MIQVYVYADHDQLTAVLAKVVVLTGFPVSADVKGGFVLRIAVRASEL